MDDLNPHQVSLQCPICAEDVVVVEDDPVLPEHSYTEEIRRSEGKQVTNLPATVEIRCIASGGRISWKFFG